MKTFQIVFELANAPTWDAEAEPISVEFTQCVPDDAVPKLGVTARLVGTRQLIEAAKVRGKTIEVGDTIRVLIYDLKQRRPLLRPTVTTWMVGQGFFGLAIVQLSYNATQLRPSLN